MKWCVAVCLWVVFLAGCALPGVYISKTNLRSYQDFQGRMQQSEIIPVDQNLSSPLLQPYAYRVGPYDMLSIIVWGEPGLSSSPASATGTQSLLNSSTGSATPGFAAPQTNGQTSGFLVNEQGCIFYPYLGQVYVTGSTVDQVRKILTKRLSKYIRSPQVTVLVSNFRNAQVHIIGEVNRMGGLPLTDKPLSLVDALETASINTMTANTELIYIVRGNVRSFSVYWFNAKKSQSLMVAERFYLRPNDIIYVAPASITNWNKALNQILPTVQAYWFTQSIVQNR